MEPIIFYIHIFNFILSSHPREHNLTFLSSNRRFGNANSSNRIWGGVLFFGGHYTSIQLLHIFCSQPAHLAVLNTLKIFPVGRKIETATMVIMRDAP